MSLEKSFYNLKNISFLTQTLLKIKRGLLSQVHIKIKNLLKSFLDEDFIKCDMHCIL